MKPSLTAHHPIRFVALVSLMLSQACIDQTLTLLDDDLAAGRYDADTREAVSAQDDLGESRQMMSLARRIPGFGGFFFEPDVDLIVVAMTRGNTTGFPAARLAVSATLAPAFDAPPQLVERVVKFSFIELARHRARLLPRLFDIPGVGSLEVDEVSNRIKVGLLDQSARGRVLDLAFELAVPLEMISFWKTWPVEFATGSAGHARTAADAHALAGARPTLQDRVSLPDAGLRGGYQVVGEPGSNKECTLGFVAKLTQEPERPNAIVPDEKLGFVSASHCSLIESVTDWGVWGQPTRQDEVGSEEVDGGSHADATFVAFHDSLFDSPRLGKLGSLGRPKERVLGVRPGSLVIDQNFPTITLAGKMDPVANMRVDKVGRTSGWTSGRTTGTCVNHSWDLWPFCVYQGDFYVDHGDSGGPVFAYDPGAVKIVGIVIGVSKVDGQFTQAIYSSIGKIEQNLGGTLTVWDDWCGTGGNP
ncbi:MAG: hypothetical protein OXG58_04035 [Gemmatimonadetes bacterium]|nr:hypothetical protein [Gemmatimonadota bacterium]